LTPSPLCGAGRAAGDHELRHWKLIMSPRVVGTACGIAAAVLFAGKAVLGTVAPALTALLGWVALHEHLGVLGWCGIAVMMIGALLISRPPRGT